MEASNWQHPQAAIACNLDTNLLRASHPLLAAGQVEALEWSFDALFQFPEIPEWFTALIQAFSAEGRLIGHGVFFSLFSGQWTTDQQAWLDRLRALSSTYQFDHITEHFGFMTGADFHKGAPLGVPFTKQTLELGQDRLKRISEAASCPVGLENLAFAYSLEEVKRHGTFLEQLLEPVNGFVILDLHNLYCQLYNFEQPAEHLLQLMPLHRVREIHISGGSWDQAPGQEDRKVRRDTHDESVPAAVFELLEQAIPQCPHLKYVVLEQLGSALESQEQQHAFQEDFRTMYKILKRFEQPADISEERNHFQAPDFDLPAVPLSNPQLHDQQASLSDILEQAQSLSDARQQLSLSPLANTAWKTEQWEDVMLETARQIAQKWKGGWA